MSCFSQGQLRFAARLRRLMRVTFCVLRQKVTKKTRFYTADSMGFWRGRDEFAILLREGEMKDLFCVCRYSRPIGFEDDFDLGFFDLDFDVDSNEPWQVPRSGESGGKRRKAV